MSCILDTKRVPPVGVGDGPTTFAQYANSGGATEREADRQRQEQTNGQTCASDQLAGPQSLSAAELECGDEDRSRATRRSTFAAEQQRPAVGKGARSERPTTSSILVRRQRQQQQRTCRTPTPSGGSVRHSLVAGRSSLESLRSRASSSSATNELESSRPPTSAGQHDDRTGAATSPSPKSVLVATRYVEPPLVREDQFAWQTVPLEDATSEPVASRLSSAAPNTNFEALNSAAAKSPAHPHSDDHPGTDLPTSPPATPQPTKPPSAADQCALNEPTGHTHGERRRSASRKSAGSLNGDPNGGPDDTEKGLQVQEEPHGRVRPPFMFAGIIGSILGSLFFSVGLLCIKLLPDGHGIVEKTKLIFFRGILLMILCAGTIIYQKSTFIIRRDEWLVNGLRSVFGFISVYGAYISLKYISMGDSTALVFSSPIWTSILSHFLLGEPLEWIKLVALPASLLGIVLIAHPTLLINMEHEAGYAARQPTLDLAEVIPGEQVAELLVGPLLANSSDSQPAANQTAAYLANQTSSLLHTLNADLDIATNAVERFDFEHRWKGIVIALATSFFVSFVYIVLKFRKTTPIQTTTFWLGVFTAVGSLVIMLFTGLPDWPASCQEWTLIIANGVCSWIGQVLLQWAMVYEEVSVLSVVRTLDVAMTFSLSALFLEEEILWTSVLGAAIIAGVVVSIMLNSWLTKKLCPAKSSERAESVTLDKGPPALMLVESSLVDAKTLKSIEAARSGSASRGSCVAA